MPPLLLNTETEKPKSRKERRKEDRLKKKQRHHGNTQHHNRNEPLTINHSTPTTTTLVPVLANNSNHTKQGKSNNSIKSSLDVDSTSQLHDTTRQSLTSHSRQKNKLEVSSSNNTNDKSKKHKMNSNRESYSTLNPDIVAALRHDDEEIAFLEQKLFASNKNSKGSNNNHTSTKQREYATLECYGDDFIDFLDDLDTLVQDVIETKEQQRSGIQPNNNSNKIHSSSTSNHKYKTLHIDNDDDVENDEFDSYVNSHTDPAPSDDDDDTNNDDSDNDTDDEIIPMKEPIIHDEDDSDYYSDTNDNIDMIPSDNVDDHGLNHNDNDTNDTISENDRYHDQYNGNDDDDDDNDDDDHSDNDNPQRLHDESMEPDHNINDTYQPSYGEDIYGNTIESSNQNTIQPSKYVPPHLRNSNTIQNNNNKTTEMGKMSNVETQNDILGVHNHHEQQEETIRVLHRSLNSILNRLSEGTVVSVIQSMTQLYGTSSTTDVNTSIWENTFHACVNKKTIIMTGLIPMYVSVIVGVHIKKGDTAQLMEYIIEQVVTKFWIQIQTSRVSVSSATTIDRQIIDMDNDDDDNNNNIQDDEPMINKEVCNLCLILCYMYNFGAIHCTLLYDIIRDMVQSCCEIDVELILLIFHHCGRTLRSDDPSAMKEIITSVQQRSTQSNNNNNNISETRTDTSRSQYMLSALMDMKNKKRRKNDQTYNEQTMKLRKILGHIKSSNNISKAVNGVSHSVRGTASSDTSLRISLRDILDVETKGRWWKVGASWAGSSNSQSLLHGTNKDDTFNDSNGKISIVVKSDTGIDDQMLQLAAKYRMNTDTRRSIFCIIMGSIDYEDCFEKLVRANMLKNRYERDTVRVLMECCGNEGTFNKFYSHLAARICEFQPQCKFTFQLAYWDTFKQFDEMKSRKVANLAKLLFHLVAIHKCLKINVIKTINIAEPETLSEMSLIFITMFFTNLLEYFDKPEDTYHLFEKSINKTKEKRPMKGEDVNDMYDGDVLQAGLTIFLVQIMKSSPKYIKGSKFRTNLKAALKACDTDNFF